jgi:benzoate-CoA ligase
MNIPEHFNFVNQLFKQSTNHLFDIALIDATQTWTYQDLEKRVKSLSTWLTGLGVRPEERVAIVLKDSADTAAILLAVMYSGMVAVPIDPRSSPTNIKYCLEHSGARLVITEDDSNINGVTKTEMCKQYNHAMATAYSSHCDSACVFMYTSGTTGHPKAVVHRHATPYIIGTQGGKSIGFTKNDRSYSAAKLFYSFGMFNLWNTLFAGASTVLHPGIFVPSTISSLLIRHQVTLTVMVPVLYSKLLEQTLDGNCLRLCLAGADKLPDATYTRWHEKTNVFIQNIYGSTEIGAACLHNSGDAPPTSIGKSVPGYQVKIIDDQLWIKASTAGLCYWHDKYWSEQQFGEWMPTGDIVSKDDQGNYYFLGRASDVVKVNGKYVDLGKIEQAVMSIPGVQEAVVVGKMATDGHTRLKAYVVAVPGQAIPNVDIQKHVNELSIIDQMPRTENGKIQRYKLRAQM